MCTKYVGGEDGFGVQRYDERPRVNAACPASTLQCPAAPTDCHLRARVVVFCGFSCLLAIAQALERKGGVCDLQMMGTERVDCGTAATVQLNTINRSTFSSPLTYGQQRA